jgi:ADP-heptose:LPS heptosyltransferase
MSTSKSFKQKRFIHPNLILRTFLENLTYYAWKFFSPYKKRIDEKEIKKVLILSNGGVGDNIVMTPMVYALAEKYGKVDIIIRPGMEKVFFLNPNIRNIFVHTNVGKTLNKIKGKYQLAIVNWQGFEMRKMCINAGIKYLIGTSSSCSPSDILLSQRPKQHFKKNIIEKNLDEARLAGADNKKPKIKFYLSKGEVENVKKILLKKGIKEYAIVHPCGAFSKFYNSSSAKYREFPSRLWPIERYAKIIDYLIRGYKLKVLITGNKDELIFSQNIRNLVKNKKDVIIANKLFELRGLAALISKTKLFICAPSGIVHVGAALNAPTIHLFGMANAYEWRPASSNCKMLFHPEVCNGCHREYCKKKTQECMLAITSEEVMGAIDEFLNDKNSKHLLANH